MTDPTPDSKLVESLRQVKLKERQVLRILDSALDRADEPESVDQLERQKAEASERERLLDHRLRSYEPEGLPQAPPEEDGASSDETRGHLPEHLQVSYALLERLARRAGDEKTARVARENRATEGGAGERISQSLDKITKSSRFDNQVR